MQQDGEPPEERPRAEARDADGPDAGVSDSAAPRGEGPDPAPEPGSGGGHIPPPQPHTAPGPGVTAPPRRDTAGNLVLGTSSAAVLIGVLALLAVGVAVHLGMVFLHVAPTNTVSRQHDDAIDSYIYPEFEQNWKLFAPNPLQHNIAVHARVETRGASGELERGGWVDLTAFDAEHIRGNPFPSHTAQNELRRAWDFYAGSHDSQNRPTGPRGKLSESYIKRIAVLRLATHEGIDPSEMQRVQIRSATTPVQPPPWSGEKIKDETKYRTLQWLPVTDDDVPEAAR